MSADRGAVRLPPEISRVLEGLGDAVVVAGTAGQVLFANAGADRMFRRPPGALTGQPLCDLVPPASREEHRAGFERYLLTGEPRLIGSGPVRVKALAGDGEEIDVELSLSEHTIDGHTVFVASLRDLADRVELEQVRALAQYVGAMREVTSHLTMAFEDASLEEAAPVLLAILGERLGWDTGAVWREEGNVLRALTYWGGPGMDAAAAAMSETSFPRGAGLPGRVWATGDPAWIGDTSQTTNLTRAPIAARHGLRSCFAFPVVVNGDVAAVFELWSRFPRDAGTGLLPALASAGAEIGRLIERSEARRHLAELADALQASLLPPRPPAMPGMEVATRYAPGDNGLRVGGDFYDVFRLSANDWAAVVGDVCGRGARAASLTGLARWTMRAAAVHHFAPSAVLTELNGALLAQAAPGHEDDTFCSVALARVQLDACGAWVTLACGGHPRPVVVRRAGWVDVRGQHGTPLGLFDVPTVSDDRVGLGPGDAIVFVTDGITEVRDERGEMFGEDQLLQVLLANAGRGADELADAVMAAAEHHGSARQRDDVALLVLRVPEYAAGDALDRVVSATGLPPATFADTLYPLGDPAPWHGRPEPPREARMALAAEAGAVRPARHLLRRMLASWRMEELLDRDVELLLTEVLTNAVLHAGGPLTIVMRYDGRRVRFEVLDPARELPHPKEAGPDDEGGRGLYLVATLASDWGADTLPEGKRVWFEVPAE